VSNYYTNIRKKLYLFVVDILQPKNCTKRPFHSIC